MGVKVKRLLGDHAKVGHFGKELRIKEDVAGFDVSVNDRRILKRFISAARLAQQSHLYMKRLKTWECLATGTRKVEIFAKNYKKQPDLTATFVLEELTAKE
jgi:hypothetical protein